MLGSIATTSAGHVTVHSYTAPEAGWRTTCHLIELPDRLIQVDAPLPVFAGELLAHAQMLGKPIDRVIITHAHPDHFATASRFGAPVHALAASGDRIRAAGAAVTTATYGLIGAPDDVPQMPEVETIVAPSTETIGGVTFAFDPVRDAETSAQLTIGLPEQGMLLTGDLVYNGVHLFVAEHGFEGWVAALDALLQGTSQRILPGHGAPGGRELITATMTYLLAAHDAYRTAISADEYAAIMDRQFPSHTGRSMRPVLARFLYPAASV